jgi:hypothetical protein
MECGAVEERPADYDPSEQTVGPSVGKLKERRILS